MVSLLRGGSPQRQLVLLFLAGLLVCAALAGIYVAFLRTDYAILFSDLRTADAATIVAELDRRKVSYRLEAGGNRILVPRDKVDETRLAVMGQDLPLKGQVGFELFNKSDMGLTEFAQRVNYQRALQGELGRTIMTMPSVESARVHLSIGERSIFRDDRVPPKASVSIVARAGRTLSLASVRGIQRLVASAVPELDAENVVVIDDDGRELANRLAADPDAAPTGAFGATELHYEDAVRRAIAGLVPSGTEVAVRADLRETVAGAVPSAPQGGTAPARQDLRLRVTVALGAPIGPDAEQRLRRAVRSAIGADSYQGDVIRITVAQEFRPEETAAQSVPVPAVPAVAPVSDGGGVAPWLWAGFALAVIGLVALALYRRRQGARVLGEKQRDAFVSRFQVLLEREEASV